MGGGGDNNWKFYFQTLRASLLKNEFYETTLLQHDLLKGKILVFWIKWLVEDCNALMSAKILACEPEFSVYLTIVNWAVPR